MSERIPQEILDEILSRTDIVELISSYIPLKRAGRNFKALCPFHQEKTPSFMVSPQRQIYHCFGCGIGGNAFNFLMQYERLEFMEAVEFLAKKTGVKLPEKQKIDPKVVSLTTQLYKINELASIYYQQCLNSQEGNSAYNYLLRRQLKKETIKLFKLGYALDKWDSLINYLRSKGVSLSILDKAGLILPKEGGGYYDRFRNRIIFPIFDIKSRAIGFGARILEGGENKEKALPKYTNSPETAIYTKGKHLYGLNFAKDNIREADFAVMVEGYLDFIIPYQEGLGNIVASLGTALTEEQIRLLKRYTNNVVMVYDSDKAGQLATLRTLDLFIEEAMNVKVVSLPEGFDPDSYVRKFGIDKFKEKISEAENLFDYKLRILKSRYNTREIEAKAQIVEEMLPTINRFKNAILKSSYLKRLSEELNVSEEALLLELKKIKAYPPYFGTEEPSKKLTLNINATEKLLIKLMLEEKELINQIRENLEPADFQDERVAKIVSVMFELINQGKSIEPPSLINYLEDNEAMEIICELAFIEAPSEDKEKIVLDCIQRIKKERLRLKRQQLHEEIKHAQYLGDESRVKQLLEEFHHLTKKR